MAKKNILNGVSSADLVNNLNAEMVGGNNLKDIIPTIIKQLNYSSKIILLKTRVSIKDAAFLTLNLIGYTHDGKKIPINTVINAHSGTNTNDSYRKAINYGYNLQDISVFYIDDILYFTFRLNQYSNVSAYLRGSVVIHEAGAVDYNLEKKNLIDTYSYIDNIPDNVTLYSKITPQYGVINNTGITFDHIDLPETVSTLDLDTLPPIANVDTIILRYNGVVQDLDTYVSQVEAPVMPLPMSEGVEVNAEMPSTLELTPGIMPMVNLDDYVGTPNNWLKIYVPNNQLYNYREKYPSIKGYILPITGSDGNMVGSRNYMMKSTNMVSTKYFEYYSTYVSCEADEWFTLTIKISDYPEGLTGFFAVLTKSGNVISTNANLIKIGKDLYSGTFRTLEAVDKADIRFYRNPNTLTGNVVIEWMKLERGMTPTDWTPALEDVDAQFDEVYNAIQSEKEYTEETYAKKDGAYEGLLAGTAMNLQGQQDVVISSMYQPTGGNLDVNWTSAEILNIKGNAVVWNQIIDINHKVEANAPDKVKFEKITNGFRLTNTTEEDLRQLSISFNYYLHGESIKGHTYFCAFNDNFSGYYWVQLEDLNTTRREGKRNKALFKCERSVELIHIIPVDKHLQPNNNIDITNLCLIDLTLIYGIGNEPTTPEQFEEDYRRWFGKNLEYEEYDDGSIRNTKATGLRTVGFNQALLTEFEGTLIQWSNKPLFINNCGYKGQIYIQFDIIKYDSSNNTFCYVEYTDSSKSYLGTNSMKNNKLSFTTDKNKIVKEIKSIYYYNSPTEIKIENICINFVWSGSREDNYEEYWEETKSLPLPTLTGKLNGEGESVVVFPDGLRRAGDIYDEIIVENGVTKAIKRIKSVKIETLPWKHSNTETYQYDCQATISDLDYSEYSNSLGEHQWGVRALFPILQKGIPNNRSESPYYNDKVYGINSNCNIYISDRREAELGTEEYIEQVLKGHDLYYTIKPEVYILDDDFQLPLVYRIDDFGTEQIIAPENTITPILTTRYGVNAVDTLRRLPQNYVSERSLNNLLYQLNSVMNGIWSKSWNNNTNSYDFSFSPNE